MTCSDVNSYGPGGEMYTPDGATWHPETGRGLKFDDPVAAG